MTRADLWQCVHAHLDAGRDPLDDPTVQAALLADPAALEEIVALRAVLTWAAVPVRARSWRRAAGVGALVVAAALVIAWGLVVVWPTHAAPPPGLPMPRFATEGSVRRVVAELCVQAGDEIVWVQREEGVVTRQLSTAFVTMAAEPPTPGRSAMVVALAYFENQLR